MADQFKGDNQHLLRCIRSLLEIDESGALSAPLGGHARTLLIAASARMELLISECADAHATLAELAVDREDWVRQVILQQESEVKLLASLSEASLAGQADGLLLKQADRLLQDKGIHVPILGQYLAGKAKVADVLLAYEQSGEAYFADVSIAVGQAAAHMEEGLNNG